MYVNEIERRTLSGTATAVGNVASNLTQAALMASPETAPYAIVTSAAVGAFSEEVVKLYERIHGDHLERSQQLMTTATQVAGVDIEELLETVTADPRKRELFDRAVRAAARSVDEEKIEILALAFASGALSQDQAKVDEAMILVDTIDQLEAPHLRLLGVLSGIPERAPLSPKKPNLHLSGWLDQDILKIDPGLMPALDALTGRLRGLGLVSEQQVGMLPEAPAASWDHRSVWYLTAFGEACVHYLNSRGAR